LSQPRISQNAIGNAMGARHAPNARLPDQKGGLIRRAA